MIVRATRDEQDEILNYLAQDVENCLYLYLDIYQYGIGSDTVSVWYEKNGENFALVALRYFDCLQVYSKDNDFDESELLRLVQETGVTKVRGTRPCIEAIEQAFEGKFAAEYGAVLEKVHARDFGELFDRVEEAKPEDLPEVVNLLLMDERNQKSYSYDSLLKSLENLQKTGSGRTYILREGDVIVASETVAAESDLFIITANLITHPDYRHLFYGTVVESYVYKVMKKDRRLFTFVVEPRRRKMLEAQGNPVITEYGKLLQVKR